MSKKLLRKIIALSIVLFLLFGKSLTYIGINIPIGWSIYDSLFDYLWMPILNLICPSDFAGAFGCAVWGVYLTVLMSGVLLYILIEKLLEKVIK